MVGIFLTLIGMLPDSYICTHSAEDWKKFQVDDKAVRMLSDFNLLVKICLINPESELHKFRTVAF